MSARPKEPIPSLGFPAEEHNSVGTLLFRPAPGLGGAVWHSIAGGARQYGLSIFPVTDEDDLQGTWIMSTDEEDVHTDSLIAVVGLVYDRITPKGNNA